MKKCQLNIHCIELKNIFQEIFSMSRSLQVQHLVVFPNYIKFLVTGELFFNSCYWPVLSQMIKITTVKVVLNLTKIRRDERMMLMLG